jgi:hypothetical protein
MVNDQYKGDGKCPVIPGDNMFSRINTPAGMYIEVFRDYQYKGNWWVFGSRNSDMSYSLAGLGADHRIRSFIIRTIPSGGVTLCKNMNCENGKVTRSVGSYKSMPAAAIGDNDLSRVILPPQWKIQVFVDESFQGSSKSFTNGHAKANLSIKFLDAYSIWNSKVSSYSISTIIS